MLHVMSRGHAQKLKMTFKIINNHSCIPKSIFQLHPHPSPRSANSCQLYAPFASTNAYKYSFFIDVVSYWNSLPQDIVNSPSPNSFKTMITVSSYKLCTLVVGYFACQYFHGLVTKCDTQIVFREKLFADIDGYHGTFTMGTGGHHITMLSADWSICTSHDPLPSSENIRVTVLLSTQDNSAVCEWTILVSHD